MRDSRTILTELERHPVATVDRGPVWCRTELLAVVAALSAGISAIGIRQLLPDRLHVTTDIVGNPIFANFNINTYFYNYYLTAIYFPLAATIAFLGLRRLIRNRAPVDESVAVSPVSGRHRRGQRGAGFAGAWLLGATLGLEVAVSFRLRGYGVAGMAAAIAAVQTILTALLARLLTRGGRASIRDNVVAINILAAPLLLLGLVLVSNATSVRVLAIEASERHAWLPLWLAAAGTAIILAWVAASLRRSWQEGTTARLEQRMLAAFVGPVLLFLFTAALPGAVGLDMYHEGEVLVPPELVRHGLFPWRDFVFIHGLFNDLIRSGLGFLLFGDTAWGSSASQFLLVAPMTWIGLYALAYRLFWRYPAILWAGGVLAVAVLARYVSPAGSARFLLWPLVLLGLAALLDHPTWPRSAAFMTLLAVQIVITPESAFALPACAIVLLCFEMVEQKSRRFPRTRRCVVVGAVLTGGFFLYLAKYGAAQAFLTETLGFARGHRLTGGVPVGWGGLAFGVAAVAPIVAAVVGVWYLAALRFGRRRLETHDWVLFASVLMVLMYYPKFLARADGHVYQVLGVSLPLFMLLASRALDRLEQLPAAAARNVALHCTRALLAIVLVTQLSPIRTRLSGVSDSFSPTAPATPERRIGYWAGTGVDRSRIDDLSKVLDAFLSPSDVVFDFSNAPALFHYLLPYRPATRYFHVSLAIRRDDQRKLIQDLRRRQPRIVVMDNNLFGLPVWDGIGNYVRHYEVSQYMLDNFQPFMEIHGHVLMAQRSDVARFRAAVPTNLTVKPSFDGVAYGLHPCDWGYAPNFLAGSDPPGPALDLRFTKAAGGELLVDLPPSARTADYRWFQIVSERGFGDGRFVLFNGSEGAQDTRSIYFRSVASSRRVLTIRVGSCPAWHAYGSTPLVLNIPEGQAIAGIRLIR